MFVTIGTIKSVAPRTRSGWPVLRTVAHKPDNQKDARVDGEPNHHGRFQAFQDHLPQPGHCLLDPLFGA
jgi:hypothetical protein